MKKIFCFFFVYILIFSYMYSLPATAETYLIRETFQSVSPEWSGGVLCTDGSISCYQFSNKASYMLSTPLSDNTAYLISFYVKSDVPSTALSEHRIFASGQTLTFSTTHVGTNWTKVVMRFITSHEQINTIVFSPFSENENSSFSIHTVQLLPISFTPIKFVVAGRQNVQIAENSLANYSYAPVFLDRMGNTAFSVNGQVSFISDMPSGISFDESSRLLSVSSTAISGTTIQLSATPPTDFSMLPSEILSVYITKQSIINGNFSDYPLHTGWNTDAHYFPITEDVKSGNLFAEVPTIMKEENKYSGTISPACTYYFNKSQMYVFRAKVRSTKGYDTRQVLVDTSVQSDTSSISIDVSQIGGSEWTEIVSAFRVPHDGYFTLLFTFSAPDSRPICVDSILIRPEEPAPADIVFDAPAHISKPKEGNITFPLFYAVCDQSGSILSQDATLAISPADAGVTLENGVVTVSPHAQYEKYNITAHLPDAPSVCSTHDLYVTDASVGDGSFEETAPGQWWATAPPSQLHFISAFSGKHPTDGNTLARLTMNGPVSVLLADSVYRYDNGKSYVFEANLAAIVPDIHTVVTVLVDAIDSNSFDDNLVIGQFTLSDDFQKIQKLFTPSISVTGRLMIAFNTDTAHDQQIILMDNASVHHASVYAENVTITGTPRVDMNLNGRYRFISNFSTIDASTYRWLISDTEDGIFMPLFEQTSATLSITKDLVGKYVRFEVTPISLSGPVVGRCAVSSPVRIGTTAISVPPDAGNTPSDDTGINMPPLPEKETLSANDLRFIDITKYDTASLYNRFFDMDGHWAVKDVAVMTAAGIVNGRGSGLFFPEEHITRAEFSAILARAFTFAPIYYTGKFTDVSQYSWYAGVIETVTKHGFAQGTSETTFSPETPITREQMAVMLMRAYKKSGAKSVSAQYLYKDIGDVSAWAVQSVGESQELGILRGMPNHVFCPKQNATRAEALVAIRRMLILLTSQFSI